jgi:hypothetical protein
MQEGQGWAETEGTTSLSWWTRSHRIRIIAELPLSVTLLEAEKSPLYQLIADKALHLKQLGLSMEGIARHLDVDGKTVAKALSWLSRRGRNDDPSRIR